MNIDYSQFQTNNKKFWKIGLFGLNVYLLIGGYLLDRVFYIYEQIFSICGAGVRKTFLGFSAGETLKRARRRTPPEFL
jgi:hypothetical protein